MFDVVDVKMGNNRIGLVRWSCYSHFNIQSK